MSRELKGKQNNGSLTIGDLIRLVARYARNDHEVGLTVADLIQRGIVRSKSHHKHFKVVV